MSTRKPFAIYAITKHGIGIAARLLAGLPGRDLYVSEKLHTMAPAGALPLRLPMGPRLVDTFDAYDCHVCIISVGAVVRMITPLAPAPRITPPPWRSRPSPMRSLSSGIRPTSGWSATSSKART